MLHLAPESTIAQFVRARTPTSYVTADLEPVNDLAMDLTKAPLRASSFDVVLCCHVLEHIVDDLAAMRELARITSRSGRLIVQVPWNPGMTTDEDPDASAEERVRRFGQEDHVRAYGVDVVDRLDRAGLLVEVIRRDDIPDGDRLGLPAAEALFVCRPA